jgi:transcriptional antiterminator NusG
VPHAVSHQPDGNELRDALVSDESKENTDEAQVSAESAAERSPAPQEEQNSSGQTEVHSPEQQSAEQETEGDPLVEESAQADEPMAEEGETEEEDIEDAAEDEVAEDEAAEDEEPAVGDEPAPEPEEIKMDWYILKVQSNRERSIADALKRKVAIEGLDEYFGEVVVPTEKVTEFKGGKKKVVERKLYPGYIVVNMCITDDTWFAVRETSGIGDFTGSGGKPTPMLSSEVARIIQKDEEEVVDSPKLNINFKIGDRVKIKDGTFESFEGEVTTIDEQNGRITVMINIFGRSTPVELEYWQVEVL